MVASPGSTAIMSDIDHPSSPIRDNRSFALSVQDDDTKMADVHTPDPADKQPRAKGKAAQAAAQATISQIGKIRHLKKEDGEPLWRKDIQYDFLKAVFDNEEKVFTNSYEEGREKQCFADLYIDTMARSSKTSKVLRDKLLSDRDAAKGMAMVCLLVNIGRMNTTLNFFPEMRAQLRTYHAIPSLQAHQDPHAYKQLQDAPRLKSILKGGAEDRDEPSSLDKIKSRDVPRTNPVNLIFVICQHAPKIAELHFPPGVEFHDLVMKTHYTSTSRAKAFLWLMWFYLESDFTEEGCEENPFGPGVDYGVDVANQGVPKMAEMTADEEASENVDPQEEIEFGRAKQKMRAKILEADQQYHMIDTQSRRGSRVRALGADDGVSAAALPRIRPSKHESDMDSTRSTPPPRAFGRNALMGGSSRRGGGLKYIVEGSSPAGMGPVIDGIVARKPRPPTAHQLAVERNRSQRVEYILDRGLRKKHHVMHKKRKREGAIYRAYKRVEHMTDPFEDSEGEESKYTGVDRGKFRDKGFGGLIQLVDEEDDFGEEISAYAAALRRVSRRLDRWEAHEGPDLGIVQPIKRRKPEPTENGEGEECQNDGEQEQGDHISQNTLQDQTAEPGRSEESRKANGRANGDDAHMKDGEDLDEVEKDLLGMSNEKEVDDGDVSDDGAIAED